VWRLVGRVYFESRYIVRRARLYLSCDKVWWAGAIVAKVVMLGIYIEFLYENEARGKFTPWLLWTFHQRTLGMIVRVTAINPSSPPRERINQLKKEKVA